MGGVGKTQLAADYARSAWNDVSEVNGLDVLIWVTASSRSSVITAYAQAGVELCRADPNDPETAAISFLAWLTPKASHNPCRWLIVLDDVTDPADLQGLWPPSSLHGRSLVTTRRRDSALAAEGRHVVELGLFTQAETVAYLRASLGGYGREEPAVEISALARELGCLPLALAQAVAYLVDTNDSVAAYRRLLGDRTAKLVDMAPDVLPDDQDLPLAAAWSLSIERADTLRPAGLARPMLHLAAFLDPNGIPLCALTSSSTLEYLTKHRTGRKQLLDGSSIVSIKEAEQALRALRRLSLIAHSPDTPLHAVRVHQLIQRATRDSLTAQAQGVAAQAVADSLHGIWPEVERDVALAEVLRANTSVLTRSAEDSLYRSAVHDLLIRTGRSLSTFGHENEAVDHFAHIAQAAQQKLGPDHHDCLRVREELAVSQVNAGDVVGALATLTALLTDQVRVLGGDADNVLITRGRIALCQGEVGERSAAARTYKEVLSEMSTKLGVDHSQTLSLTLCMIQWRDRIDNWAGAGDAYAVLVSHMRRALGEDHPVTLNALSHMAAWRGEAGDEVGAVKAYEQILQHKVRVYGNDHPTTRATRFDLAGWRERAGDHSSALNEFTELVTEMRRVNGGDHEYTLGAELFLAESTGEVGDAAGAAGMYDELLPRMRSVFGADHPYTLSVWDSVAEWQAKAGDISGAAERYAELIPHMRRVLGPRHSDTLYAEEELERLQRALEAE